MSTLLYEFIIHGWDEINIQRIIWWKIRVAHFFYLLVAAFIFFIITLLLSILGIIKAEADTNLLTVSSLIYKKTFSIDDIAHYYVTTHKNGYKTWTGLLLSLKSGKLIQLSGQNLKSIPDLINYLNASGIICKGERKTKYPFN